MTYNQAAQRQWYLRNRAKVIAATKAWKLANPEAVKLSAARHRDTHNAAARRWTAAHPEQAKEIQAAKRARNRLVRTEKVKLETLRDKAAGHCGICKEELDSTLVFPNPYSTSIDHIVPLSKDGSHTLENLQLAHLQCNVRKGAILS